MKNKMMRVAVIMMALVLVTSCFVGGTFAKYTTADDASDSARVAEFGVTVTATSDAFKAEYDTDTDPAAKDGNNADISVTVSAEESVVAPGTTGNLFATTIEGAPEVAVAIGCTADLTLTGWTLADNNTVYCPIVFTITANGTETTVDASTLTTIAAIEEAIETALTNCTANYEPNTDLASKADLSVSWTWAFEADDTGAAANQTDVNDTYLGDQAAEGNASEIALDIEVTVTQID